MSQLDYARFATAFYRDRKWTRILMLGLVVAALMAVSFTLGRATMGGAGPMTPTSDHSVIQPTGPLTGSGQVGCRLHTRC